MLSVQPAVGVAQKVGPDGTSLGLLARVFARRRGRRCASAHLARSVHSSLL